MKFMAYKSLNLAFLRENFWLNFIKIYIQFFAPIVTQISSDARLNLTPKFHPNFQKRA